jgi:hypothetical protein
MTAVIVIGRKELFSFAERHSSRRLTDYSGLADGEVLCCLFNLVFPELRIRPAAPQTHSATQRRHRNWEALFSRFARLCIPLEFLQPSALLAGSVECGFSTLVLFYFLHHLSKQTDFSAEFALDVADGVTAFLQSTDCIAALLLGNALPWSAIPEALVRTLEGHPGFHMSAEAAAEAEAAAVALYRRTHTRQRRQRTGSCAQGSNSSHQSIQRRLRTAATSTTTFAAGGAGDGAEEKEGGDQDGGEEGEQNRETPMPVGVQSQHMHSAAAGRAPRRTNGGSSSSTTTATASSTSEMQRKAPQRLPDQRKETTVDDERSSGSDSEGSPLPRAPFLGAATHSVQSHQRKQQQHQLYQPSHSRPFSHRDARYSVSCAPSSSSSSRASAFAHSGAGDFDSSIDISGVEEVDATMPGVSRRLLAKANKSGRAEPQKNHSAVASAASSCSSLSSSSRVSSHRMSVPTTTFSAASSSQESQLGPREGTQSQRQHYGGNDGVDKGPLHEPHQHHRILRTNATDAAPLSELSSSRTRYRAAPSVGPRSTATRASSSSSGAEQAVSGYDGAAQPPMARDAREAALEAQLQSKEEECETLQLRVAQLLSLLANVKTNAMSASPPPPAAQAPGEGTPAARTLQQYAQRIADLQAQLSAYESQVSASPSHTSGCISSSAAFTQAVEDEMKALTSAVVDEDTGAVIDVDEKANLLHCLLLEHLHDSPRNRDQMQQWLWSLVAAYHTLEGRLLAAAELMHTLTTRGMDVTATAAAATDADTAAAASPSYWCSSSSPSPAQASPFAHTSPDTTRTASQPRSQSTVAAAFMRADSSSSYSLPNAQRPAVLPSSPPLQTTTAEMSGKQPRDSNKHNGEPVEDSRTRHYADLEKLHAREHQLVAALHAAQARCTATVHRAAHRERLWKRLCAEVYAAEQASFAITTCETTQGVEAALQERDGHYAAVEQLTQQLVEDSVKGGGEGEAAAEVGGHTPCAALQALVTHLKEERAELLSDVARMHGLLVAMQYKQHPPLTQHDEPFSSQVKSAKEQHGATQRFAGCSASNQLPAPPLLHHLSYPTTPTFDMHADATAAAAPPYRAKSGPRSEEAHRGAVRPPRGLTSLLKEDATVYPVA